MEFDNIDQIIAHAQEHLETHDIRKTDLVSCDTTVLGKNLDPKIKRLTELDKHGEYLGRYWHTMSSSPNYQNGNKITFFIRKDGKLGGIWSSIMGMIDTYEVFDHYDGYHVGTRYMVMGSNVSPMFLAYYVTEGGKVKQIIEMSPVGLPEMANITRIILDYDGEAATAVSAVNQSYRLAGSGYALKSEHDLLAPEDTNDREDRIIDDQKALCKKLKVRAKKCSTLEEYVDAFFEVIETARENPEEDISYTAGTNPVSFPGHENECIFNLMRCTPQEDDEYYQLQMDIKLDVGNEKIPYDIAYDDGGKLKERVLASDSFKALKDRKILNVDIGVIET